MRRNVFHGKEKILRLINVIRPCLLYTRSGLERAQALTLAGKGTATARARRRERALATYPTVAGRRVPLLYPPPSDRCSHPNRWAERPVQPLGDMASRATLRQLPHAELSLV